MQILLWSRASPAHRVDATLSGDNKDRQGTKKRVWVCKMRKGIEKAKWSLQGLEQSRAFLGIIWWGSSFHYQGWVFLGAVTVAMATPSLRAGPIFPSSSGPRRWRPAVVTSMLLSGFESQFLHLLAVWLEQVTQPLCGSMSSLVKWWL